jgi:hypothetical protein
VNFNEPGDVVIDVPESLDIDPFDGWKWDGAKFVSFPTPKNEDLRKKALLNAADKGSKDGDVKALAQALKDYLS